MLQTPERKPLSSLAFGIQAARALLSGPRGQLCATLLSEPCATLLSEPCPEQPSSQSPVLSNPPLGPREARPEQAVGFSDEWLNGAGAALLRAGAFWPCTAADEQGSRRHVAAATGHVKGLVRVRAGAGVRVRVRVRVELGLPSSRRSRAR